MKLRSFVLALSLSATAFAPLASAEQRFARPPTARPEIREDAPIDRAALRSALAGRRKLVIERFLAYRNRKVYPVGILPGGGFRHVWRDTQNNLCAAATLLSLDWGRDAAIAVGQANVELKLASVKTGPVADWMLSTGLTHHELVAIQVPGWDGDNGQRPVAPEPQPDPQARANEVDRLYGIYVDVERQLTDLEDESLDEVTDAVMKRPTLAAQILANQVPGAPKRS